MTDREAVALALFGYPRRRFLAALIRTWLQRPLSDAQLDAKFSALAGPVLGPARADAVAAACRRLADAADVRGLTALCRP